MKFLARIALYGVGVLCIALVVLYAFNIERVEVRSPVFSAPAGTSFTEVNGEALAYSEVNNKASTAIIFVGGLSGWHGTWDRTISALQKSNASKYNFIALDLPPFGYSSPDARGYLRSTQGKRIHDFIDRKLAEEKVLKHVILVAHSYGAGPSTEALMIDKDHIISKFVIIDGVLNVDEQQSHTNLMNVLARITPLRNLVIGIVIHIQPLVRNRLQSFVYVKTHVDDPLVALYARPFNTIGTTQMLSDWMLDYVRDPLKYKSTDSNEYKNLKIPVRLIWGVEDTLTPIAQTTVLLGAIPDSKLNRLEGVGHIPMIEDYALFDTALRNAIAE